MKVVRKETIQMLKAVVSVSAKSEFQCADKKVLQTVTGKTYDSTSVLLYRLHKNGYVSNPIRGFYKITELGKTLLSERTGTSEPTPVAACLTSS
jgi:hypothetical protein